MPLPDHSGQTCIIIGNGPSLKDVPRSFLDAYPTLGCNFLNRLPYYPTYYTCIDTKVLTESAGEIYTIASLARLCFISNYVPDNLMLSRLRKLPNHIAVGKDSLVFEGERYMSGNTAAYVNLKIAFFMGFTRALLVGVDHSKGWKHFTDNYPSGPGTNFEGQMYHFRLAQTIYGENGREIINLSAPSDLDEFFERGLLTDYI